MIRWPHAPRRRLHRSEQTGPGWHRTTSYAPVPAWPAEYQVGPAQDHATGQPTSGSGPPARTRLVSRAVHATADVIWTMAAAEISQARLIASRLTAVGKPVSRRALHSEGDQGLPTRL
jgi:hypothetical protein